MPIYNFIHMDNLSFQMVATSSVPSPLPSNITERSDISPSLPHSVG